MDKAIHVLGQKGGVARRVDLFRAGVTEAQLRKAVKEEQIVRTVRGIYALPGSPSSLNSIYAAKALPACVTAAKLHGLWVLHEPAELHVAVDHGRPLRAFKVHRHAGVPSELDVLEQCMRCLPELEALVIVESAVVQGHVRMSEMRDRLSGRNDAKLRRISDQINPHSESIIETVGRYHLQKAGYHVQTQVRVQGVGRLDLFVDGVLGVEVDGAGYHSSREAYREDRRRWNRLTRGAVPILRVTYEMAVHQPVSFIALVRETLANL
ncbi:MAG TPA: type IV toxin-antitoxin system AbiEi family antitoxin domain-containing protein [Arthrobacter sp.]|nr:type IV toxin-antitoxin system AbiEi family antitoxin domain-containing protein [Arthrobacter sp.]